MNRLHRVWQWLMWVGIVFTVWTLIIWASSYISPVECLVPDCYVVLSHGMIQLTGKTVGTFGTNPLFIPFCIPVIVIAIPTVLLTWPALRAVAGGHPGLAWSAITRGPSVRPAFEERVCPRSQLDKGHWRLIFWAGLVAICLGQAGLRAWQEHRQSQDRAEWWRKAQVDNARQLTYERIRNEISGRPAGVRDLSDVHLDTLEPLLGEGARLTISTSGRRTEAVWTHPGNGAKVTFRFEDGSLSGYSFANHPRNPIPQVPLSHLLLKTFQLVFAGSSWLGIGTGQWLLLLICFVFVQPHRPLVAELMLATVLLWVAAWIIVPGVRTPWMSAAILMATLSVSLLIWSRRERKAAGHFCLSCGYNLTGNVSGVCPECGSRVPASSTPASPPLK